MFAPHLNCCCHRFFWRVFIPSGDLFFVNAALTIAPMTFGRSHPETGSPMMQSRLLPLFILTLIASTTPAADDWSQFRGPDGQGHSAVAGLPLTWSETENVVWKTPVEGRGWSSPVVVGDEVWVTTALAELATAEESKRKLESLPYPVPSPEVARSVTLKAVCLDRDTGRLVRCMTLFETDELFQICAANSYASPTPVAEPGRLYCDFGSLGTACIDTTNGKILWKRHLVVAHQVGPGSSPILCGEKLILVRDGCDVQYIAALDKNTGETIWKTDRPPIDTEFPYYKKAFSTPLVVEAAGRKQMIVPGARWLVSYDPDSGRSIWQAYTGKGFSNASCPVFGHGMVYVCTGFGESLLQAVLVDGQGDVSDTHIAWTGKKQVPKKSSPVLVGDELYTVSDNGITTCYDARMGAIHWSKRVLGNCSASPLFADGRVYFFDEDGKTTAIQPGKELKILAENQVDGCIMASPAIADRALFLRTDSHLYRIQEK